ncbi:homeobox protein NANOG [Clinocottus analis]|uniref:homeobox protein NANOG n=1 Tax=Clinocottus analis TaxID=304258 RepID=UPI0035BF73C9
MKREIAGWKTQLTYNYNQSYRAYTYGLMYQFGSEKNLGNPTGWAETGATDLTNYNGGGVTQAWPPASLRAWEESLPHSLEQNAVNGHGHYQGPGVVYHGDTQAGRILLPGPHQAPYNEQTHQAGSGSIGDSISDSDAYSSPNSWTSGSSREGSLPQTDPSTWVKKLCDEAIVKSPDVSEVASGSAASGSAAVEPGAFAVNGNEGTKNATSLELPATANTAAVMTPKGKVRAAFSESQMNALVQRFSVQRYLTPAEMKNLAELTGLTYKQVKTWFQNRRMKLRRHQKDTSWVSERYNKGIPMHGTMYANGPPHMPPYQGEVPPALNQHYNPHMMETAFKNTPQNMAFYLTAMGSAAGSTGYPSWSPNPPQTGMPTRPQVPGWSMPPGVNHYEYNPNVFHPASATATNNTGPDGSFNFKDGDPVSSYAAFNMPMAHNGSQY